MMALRFAQRDSNSGVVTGKGIDWWWYDGESDGDMEAIEVMARHIEAAIREDWLDLINEDNISDLPYEATVRWDGEDVEDVTDITFNFEFDPSDLKDSMATLQEVQNFFLVQVCPRGPLRLGENICDLGEVGDETEKTITITFRDYDSFREELKSIPTLLPELTYTDNSCSTTATEEDPDGADRGGYHQVTESIMIKGGVIVHGMSTSDYYEERFGEEPEPEIEDQESAVGWLRIHLDNCRAACTALEQLVKLAEAAVGYIEADWIDEDDEDDEDED